MQSSEDLPAVRKQYEELPYPPRDPRDEERRLVRTWLDDLAMINHYCYGGMQSFRNGFRVLVAGGGTGDATIFLAEQLRHTNAEIVHLDISRASSEIARQRAQYRGLSNVNWINESLLRLPSLSLGRFDYINCSGVLHHLADPDAGLAALLGSLKDNGAIGLMVYGQYGRTGIYHMQSLMRLINGDEADRLVKIRNTREVLNILPHANWFKRAQDMYASEDVMTDAGIYDLLLHSQDRAYTVGQLFQWLCDQHGLCIELTDVGRGRSAYTPELVLGPHEPSFLARVRNLPTRRQYEISELLSGNLITHSLYAARSPMRAPYRNIDYVPFFHHEPVTGADLAQLIRQHKGKPFTINHQHTGINARIDPGKFGVYILQHLDGERSFGDIFDKVRAERELASARPSDQDLFDDFKPFFDLLTALDRLLLRHRSIDPFRSVN